MGVALALQAGNFFPPNRQPFGYVAAPAASNRLLASGTETLFAPYFDQISFGGDLLATPVGSDGRVDYLYPRWRASQTLKNQHWDTGRAIVTSNGAAPGYPFAWDTLTAAQRLALDPTSAANAALVNRTDSPVLNFLRGDRSREFKNGGPFRDRASPIGDIIHGTPRFVAGPAEGYLFDAFPAFAAANAGRAGRVYVGANDGMLHAFDAASGAEMFAYVPSAILGRMPKLATRPYLHEYLVDGPITVRSARYDGAWHSVLVGALGGGGQGYYALDVSNAENAAATTEAVAAGKVLWEFNDTHDANLGFSYGRALVVRLEDGGRWVVLLPNGYVNSATDAHTGDGRARLFAVDVKTGVKLGEIPVSDASDLSSNPNGLSSPTAVDSDGNGRVDTVFAGDIKGNLWRFDIRAAPASWSNADARRIFTATDGITRQSITTAPEVTLHPADDAYAGTDLMVLFGTGRLLDSDDYNPLLVTTDSIYGLWVPAVATTATNRTSLLRQTLSEATHGNGSRVRTASNNLVDWSTHAGWLIDLPPGERLLGDPQLRQRRLELTTTNPMLPSGENWYLTLGYASGGAPHSVVIDVNRDNTLDAADNVDGNGDDDTSDPEDRAVGQFQQFGLASQPLLATLDQNRNIALINHLTAINPAEVLPETSDPGDPGLRGGHFDLDVSHLSYPFGRGTTDVHTHEWDDKTGLSSIDLMNILRCNGGVSDCLANPDLYSNDPRYNDVPEKITDPNKRFHITTLNAQLSPGGVLEINGSSIPVVAYAALVREHINGGRPLPQYQLGPNPPPGVTQLTSLKLSFSANAILQGGLIGSATGCVRGNDPGRFGEYRNGALAVQVVDSATAAMHPGQLYATGGLLWEMTVFWHWKGGCYGTEKWQQSHQTCIVEGNICSCLDAGDHPQLCPTGGASDPTPDTGGTTNPSGCTATRQNPNPRAWLIELEKPMCGSSVVAPDEFKLEFEKNVTSSQRTTLLVRYNTGSSQSISFSPTDLFASRSGSPIQFDMTGVEFKGSDVKTIKLRNVGTADLVIDRIDVSWTGGDAGQKLKKIKRERPTKNDYTAGLPAVSVASVAIGTTLKATGGGPQCLYSLAVDYTDATGASQRAHLDFDDTLTGIGGYPLEIDLDEARLDGNTRVTNVRIRSAKDKPLTITGAWLTWNAAPAGQKLRKIRDVTGNEFDVTGSGSVSPAGRSGLSIGLGGVVYSGAQCPVDAPADGTNDGTESGGQGGADGSGSGSTAGGTEIDGGTDSAVGALSGFSISSTTTGGGGRAGRLLWRELVQ